MTFTDNDLERLKEINDANRKVEGMTVFPVVKIDALLARLEAAELVCRTMGLGPNRRQIDEVLENWLKVAGK